MSRMSARLVLNKFVMTFDLVQLSVVCAAKSKNSCVESTQEANKRVERGQRGEGWEDSLSPK